MTNLKSDGELLAFYLNNRKFIAEAEQMESYPGVSTSEQLKKAPQKKAFAQLKNLCNSDKDCMTTTLERLAFLPAMRKMDEINKKDRRVKQKNESQQRKRVLNKRRNEIACRVIFDNALTIPKMDNATLTTKIYERIKSNPDDLKMFTEKKSKENIPNKENVLFNKAIFYIYVDCKSTTRNTDNSIFANIAKLLNSLQIKKPIGNDYQRTDIRSIVNPMIRQHLSF